MKYIRYLLIVLIFIFCLITPGTVFYYMSPWGIRPDLIMLWAIYFSLHSPPRPALMMAFVTGLLTDLYIGSAIGMHTFALCVVVLVSIRLQKGWDKNNMLLVTVLVFGATLIGQSVMVLLAVLSGLSLSLWMSIQIALGVSIYNALLVVLTYPLIHRSFKRGLLGKA